MKVKIYLFLTVTLISQTALSNEAFDDEEMALSFEEEYVSIATGFEEVLSRAPAVASVITSKQIKAMGARTLDDILVSVPGVHVGISPSRFTPIYTIRGIHTPSSAQVLVLINNVPITQLFKGDRGDFSAIPASTIKQVEVIRGPGSAIYGADAFSGVINVITKTADSVDGLHISGGKGSFNTQQASLLYGANYRAINYLVAVDYYTSDGDKNRTTNTDTQSIFDSSPLNTTASLASGPNGPGVFQTQAEHIDIRTEISNDKWNLRLWNWIRNNMGLGPGDSQAIDTQGSFDLNNYLLDLTYNAPIIKDNIRFQSTFSYMQVNSDARLVLFPSNTRLPLDVNGNLNTNAAVGAVTFTDGYIGSPSYKEEHTRLDMQLFITDIGDHRVRIGAGILDAKLTSVRSKKNFGPGVLDAETRNFGPLPSSQGGTLNNVYGDDLYILPHDRNVYYLSLQNQWYLSPTWDLTVGLRHDKYSDFGETTNPRLALIWHPTYDLTTKILYGKAFRAPSFATLYLQNNPVILSNKDLSPERIEMLELAIDYQISFDLKTRLSLYQYRIDRLIQNVPIQGSNTLIASNFGESKSPGLEWELTWQASNDLSITGNYAFQDARDSQNGGPVGNSPRQKIFLMGQWQATDQWNVSSTVNWIADRQRVKNDPRDDIDDYLTADLIISQENKLKGWGFELIVKNIFDVNAKEPSPYSSTAPKGAVMPDDYPLASRSFFLSMHYKP